ncbi:MAG TPA: S41 family peptidase [Streptosporangiaceae bacterium]|nr:S41 family peptidase [Streptosporangiaceae bacterium]
MTAPGYLRYPNLRGDLLTFTADNDIWLAPAGGGRAWRISADQAAVADPRISPDGSLVAWTSWRDGSPEVYLASTGHGGAARVSYWSNQATRVRGWSPAGEILATTAAGQAFERHTWAVAIPVAQGTARFSGHRTLPFGPVGDLTMDGSAVALLTGTAGLEPAFWKRYRGGRAGRLWVGLGEAAPGESAPGTAFRRLLADVPGQFFSPMLVSGRLAFLSDHEGTANVYSCDLDGTDLRRHTDHEGRYPRNASTDGARIVYQYAGDIWLLDNLAADSQPVRLEIELTGPAAGRAPRLISADDYLDDLYCDWAGKASVVQVRGTVHWLTHRDGPARALSVVPGRPARLPRPLGRTGQAVWVVEADGTDALEVAPADEAAASGERARRLAAGEIGWVGNLAAAPDGHAVAAAARDGRLFLIDTGSGQVTELARSDNGPITGLAFAPDSAWLAWSQPDSAPLRRLRLARLSDRQVFDVTDGRFVDTDPAFTADGRYLAFLSKRTFDPVHDAHVFDLTFPYGARPHLLTLAASTPSPFGPLLHGRPIGGPKEDAGEAAPDGADEDHDHLPVVIDLDGIGSRVVALPVPEARYSSLRAVDGGLAWLTEPLTGDLGEGRAHVDDSRPRPALEYFDLAQVKCTELLDEVNWFEPSGDGTRLVVRDRHQILVVPANRKADSDNADDRVCVDLSRARFLSDPAALWNAAYAQAGLAIAHEFWTPDLAEVDWDAVLAEYRPLLDRIASADDFADLLHDLVGELGSSHAYVRAADDAADTGHAAGLLGADLTPGTDGWRIGRILPGESSDPRARSPLRAPGAGLLTGDLIVAVDGQQVTADAGPGPLLVGSAGKPVELTVRRAGEETARRAVVVPLASELRLRYQDWVAGRRRAVRELGDGRVGYLHVPDMASQGWSDFHRDLRTEMGCEALVVDVRGNRGGEISQLVLEKLARRVIGWDVVRNARPSSYPLEAPRGPVIAVADEYCASDGDIITAAIKLLGIGTVVGTRTWGGVIGIEGWHELVDGTSITVPKWSFWFDELGWSVENYGVEPDVEVVMSPQDWAAGNDPQLATAVRLALAALAQRPAASPPDTADRPSRRRLPLPPRPVRR